MRTIHFSLCAAGVLAAGCVATEDLGDGSADARAEINIPDVAHEPYIGPCDLGDAGVFPQGTRLVSSNGALVLGVTSDDHAVYEDRGTGDLYLVPLAGGVPEQFGPAWNSTSTGVYINGKVSFYWTGVDFTKSPFVGQLIEWSAASPTDTGKARVLSTSSFTGAFAASSDGTYVAFSDNVLVTFPPPDAGGGAGKGTTDLVVAHADGTGKTKIASGLPYDSNCFPSMVFAGNTLITATCASPPAFMPAANIQTYAAPNWSPTKINQWPTYTGIGVSPDKSTISYFTAGNTLIEHKLGGNPVAISSSVDWNMFTNDGTSVIYMDTSGHIHRSPLTVAAPSYISYVQFNVNAGLWSLSPDDKWLIVARTQDNQTGLYDAYLLSTAPNSVPITLDPKPNAANLGDFFTANSAYTFFGANNVPAPLLPNYFYGDFAMVPLATPTTPPVTISPKTAWTAYATSGSKVIFNDNYDIVYPALPTADIQVLDLASANARTKLASHADANFYLTADKKRAVYSWTYCADDYAGLYVVDVP